MDKHLIENPQIRIFISSTFNDMQVERDYLVNDVFQPLRQEVVLRDVSLVELDLRWMTFRWNGLCREGLCNSQSTVVLKQLGF